MNVLQGANVFLPVTAAGDTGAMVSPSSPV